MNRFIYLLSGVVLSFQPVIADSAEPADPGIKLVFEKLPHLNKAQPKKKKTLVISKTAIPPLIDGKINDLCWKNAMTADGFTVQGKKLAEAQTNAWLTYDDKNLYIAFCCQEPYLDKIKAGEIYRDGEVWEDDCVEIMIAPNPGRRQYYHFIINSRGIIYDGNNTRKADGHIDKNISWSPQVTAKTSATGSSWSLEMAVPLKEISLDDNLGLAGINLYRERKTRRENSCWSPLAGVFHQPACFGHLAFKRDLYTITDFSFSQSERRVEIKLKNENNQTGELTASVKITAPSGAETTSCSKFDISAGEEKTIDLPVKMSEETGTHSMTITLSEPRSGKIYHIIKNPITVSKPEFSVKVVEENKILFDHEKLFKTNIAMINPPVPLAEMAISTAIQDSNEKVIRKKEIVKMKSSSFVVSFNPSKLMPGHYYFQISISNRQGKILFQTKGPFWIIERY
ncbi:MAG: carbohydrate-binding family 9-like protein [Victivallales bacterium]